MRTAKSRRILRPLDFPLRPHGKFLVNWVPTAIFPKTREKSPHQGNLPVTLGGGKYVYQEEFTEDH